MSSIPLMVQPAAAPQGPLQQAQTATSLQALINQTRMQQQAIQQQQAMAPLQQQQAQLATQQQQIATQEQQQQFDDTQKFNQAFKDAGGDWDQAIQKATEAGASGAFITKAQMARAGQVAQMAKAHSDVLDNQQKQLDLVGQGAIRLKNITDPGQRLTAQHQLFNELVSEGIDPAHLQDLNSGSLTDTQLDQHINESKAALAMVKDAQAAQKAAIEQPAEKAAKQAETYRNYNSLLAPTTSDAQWQAVRASIPDELKSQFPEHWSPENVQSAAHNSLTPEQQLTAGTSKAVQDSRYLNILHNQALGQPISADDKAFVKAWNAKTDRETILRHNLANDNPLAPPGAGAPALPLNPTAGGQGPAQPPGQSAQGAVPAAPVKPATNNAPAEIPTPGIERVPAQIRGRVQQVLDYRAPDLPTGRQGSPNSAVMEWVTNLDPQHDATTYGARNKILQQYTKDMGSGSLGSINTALGHLNELQIAAKAVEQSDVPLLNSIANKLGAAVGNDAATTYTAILHRVGPEMTSAYVKGGGGEKERGANESDFDISKGAKQIESNINESAMLLNSKLAAQRKNWNDTFQPYRESDKFDNRFLTPDAKTILQTASQAAPTARAAAAGNIPAGARTASGPGGHKIYVQGNQWIDSVTGKPLGQ